MRTLTGSVEDRLDQCLRLLDEAVGQESTAPETGPAVRTRVARNDLGADMDITAPSPTVDMRSTE